MSLRLVRMVALFIIRNGNYNEQLPQYQIGVYDHEHGQNTTITSCYASAFTPTL